MENIGIYNKLTDLLKTKASEILPKGSRLALYGSRAHSDARDKPINGILFQEEYIQRLVGMMSK